MSESEIHERVAAQFGPRAGSYVTSETHSKKSVLDELVDLVRPNPSDLVLDIATGGGHTALAFAPHVTHVTALDLTPSMLDAVEALAEERGILNVTTVEARAEELPFDEASQFDLVTVRLAPHHFADVPRFLSEVNRVLFSGGRFLLVDTTVPEDPALDREINRLELLRDPSHVRNYRPSEWQEMVEAAGFEVEYCSVGLHAGGAKMELMAWIERINTPMENREELIGAFFNPTPEMVEVMKIERSDDVVTFTLPELTLLARKR